MTPPVARLVGITRRFGSVDALVGADLDLRAGEIHGVLGENGAGKSTLFNILGGMLEPDAGSIEIEGRPSRFSTPREAWREGIGLVHQHFTLVPRLTVLENLALGRGRGSSGLTLPLDSVRDRVLDLGERTGLAVPFDAEVTSLSVGDRQRVEILKALLREPRILVLDEPTAVLGPGEVERLFELLRTLASEGSAVALVAHKLDEVLAVADRVTVLRAGRTVMKALVEETDANRLVLAMVGTGVVDWAAVGREPRAAAGQADGGGDDGPDEAAAEGRRSELASQPLVATLTDVRMPAGRGWALKGIDLSVRRGEVVGVVGVEGNGQRELALVLSGRLRPVGGRADLPGGIGYIPQDRTTEGVIGDFDLVENVALGWLHDGFRSEGKRRGLLLPWEAVRKRAEAVRIRYGVRTSGLDQPVRTLSGGNQQRVVVGREIGLASDLLVAENPTRGLDVSAASFVHGELRRLVEAEACPPGVVLLSSDIDEVLHLSDRVFAMVRGELVPVPAGQWTREGVGVVMLGGGHNA